MRRRVVAVLRARLGGRRETSSIPVGPLLMLAGIAALFGDVAAEILPPFSYGVFTLSTAGALIAIPLLGEVGAMLRSDEASEWIEAQPVRPIELRIARTLHALIVLALLSLAALLPAALLAPGEMRSIDRALLLLAGLGQVTALAAVLLGVQAVLGGRGEALLLLLQTALVTLVLVGGLMGLRLLPQLAPYDSFESVSGSPLVAYPPCWFAAVASGGGPPALAAVAVTVLALGVLLALPEPRRATARRAAPSLVERALRPLVALAARFWVARDERAAFELVVAALPREREFKLRTYPLLGLPLAFFAGARGEAGLAREIMLALVSFLPAVYLPVLISQVPGSASHRARWLLESAPITDAAIRNGTLKALTVRFLVPAYVLLGAVTTWMGGVELSWRFVVPGFLVTLATLRGVYGKCVEDLPLSVSPEDVVARIDWSQIIIALSMAMTLAATLAAVFVTTSARAAAVIALLVLLELAADRAQRRQSGAQLA